PVLGRPICRLARSAASSTCTTRLSCAMRFTEHKETPVNRATSVLARPALNKISTSCRLNIPSIPLAPPAPAYRPGEAQEEFYLLRRLLDGSEFPESGGSEFPELRACAKIVSHSCWSQGVVPRR